MAGFPEIIWLLGLLVLSLASLGLVMYIMYRLGLYVALKFVFTEHIETADEAS